ncbi:MAG: hypothetical protein KBS43_05830 [Oscillospiraceae bacterium]|nr:hypothetical protein [Candidatus Limimonas coprohippi]
MRGDLNDQFQRAQNAANDDNTTQKIIIGVSIFVAFCFFAIIIAGVVFFCKTADKFINTEPVTSINRELVTEINDINSQLFGNGSTSNTGSNIGSNTAGGLTNSDFEFGTITGTTYRSNFSGLTFVAPNDWILTSYATSSPSKSPKDMSASGNGMNCSVTLQYESMKTNGYKNADDSLESTQKMIDSYGYSVIDKNAVAKWGGNKFSGIIFKDTFGNYKEVLVSEVNGYVLKITLSGSTEDNLAICRSYFS